MGRRSSIASIIALFKKTAVDFQSLLNIMTKNETPSTAVKDRLKKNLTK